MTQTAKTKGALVGPLKPPARRSRAGVGTKASPSPATLALDIGGTGLKASVLGPDGALLVDRVRVPTPYPLAPGDLVRHLHELVRPLPAFDRISAGFPGMVRAGRILSAPHFVTAAGPGTKVVPELLAAWTGFDLAAALEMELGKPARVVNDADMQGGAVIKGEGLEVVITLGTGLGTAIYHEGHLAPHMELAHHPFRKGETYDEQIGEEARKRLGNKKWSRRVALAIQAIDALLFYDHLYIGGGNSARLKLELGPKETLVDNVAGIAGGLRLWTHPEPTP